MCKDTDDKNRLKLILVMLQSSKLFSEVVDHYIHRNGKKQLELAKELNVDTSAITHWRKGRRMPQDSGLVYAIASALMLDEQERQYLLLAWHITRGYRDLIPYIQTAIEEGDEATRVVESVIEYLQNSLQTIGSIE